MDKKNPHEHHDHLDQHCGGYTPPAPSAPPCVPNDDYGDNPCCSGPEIQPAHGWVTEPVSRAEFAFRNGWIGGDSYLASEMEGGKNFPRTTSEPMIWFPPEARPTGGFYQDVASAIPPADGYIVSGGRTDVRDIVNYTDSELSAAKGTNWPRYTVSPGQTIQVNWEYRAPHKTRGYRFFITHDDWNPNARLSRSSFQTGPASTGEIVAAPFFSDFHREDPYWSYPLPVKHVNNVPLPYGKIGHHVLLALWVVADTGMAFYQAIDLQFVDQSLGWSAPEYPLWDKFCTYYPNDIVRWGCGTYKACHITQGTEPGKRAPDGSYPWIPL